MAEVWDINRPQEPAARPDEVKPVLTSDKASAQRRLPPIQSQFDKLVDKLGPPPELSGLAIAEGPAITTIAC